MARTKTTPTPQQIAAWNAEGPWARTGDGEAWRKIEEFKAKHEVADTLVEAQTCDTCGAPETDQNPLESRSAGAYGQAGFEAGPPEHWMECAACASKDEIPY